MKKYILFLLSCLLLNISLFAQNKTFTMKQAILGLRQDLKVQNIRNLSWIPEQNAFAKAIKFKDNPSLVKVAVPNLKTDTLFNLSELNQKLFNKDSLRHFPTFHWVDAKNIYFKIGQTYYKGNSFGTIWSFKKWMTLPKNCKNAFVGPKGKEVAYTKGHNLFFLDRYGNTKQVTHEKNKWVQSGKVVSRNEFGINKGIFFSPKGNFLAFYKMDERKVTNYPVVNWNKVPAKVHYIKYPFAGHESQHVSVGVFNPVTGKVVYMQTNQPYDWYLTNVTWGPDEKYLYIATLSRNQKHLKLKKYNAKTGEWVKTLFEENDLKYLRAVHPLYFIPKHDNQFIWWSQRDGFDHLYRYNTDGKLLNKVTTGSWRVNTISGWNTDRQEIIITASKLSPMDKTVYAVNWENGKMRRLDNAPGIHQALVNSDGNYWIDRYTNYHTPRKINVETVHGRWQKNLLTASNTIKDFAKPIIKELTITAADGHTPLYARLILPPDFDSNKTYPVIDYLYNGPGIQLLHHRFPETGKLWYNYLAQQGYIVFTMDGRGSSNRGLKFEQVTYHQLGKYEMKDQLEGVKYLKKMPYVDADRLGLHGWSFGGFMTVSLMLKYPNVFKCAVAGGPVIDWRMYEVMYTERYMGKPQNNLKGYEETGLLDKVNTLKGDLLVIHGTSDSTVVWQNSIRFIKACVDSGIQVDYFVYPGHPHNVRGKDRVHLMQKVTDYFDEHLKGKIN